MSAKDALARGARSATFTPNKNVTQAKWDAAFDDFDPDTYRNKTEEGSDPNAEKCKVKVGI
jgi:hypothetical protein